MILLPILFWGMKRRTKKYKNLKTAIHQKVLLTRKSKVKNQALMKQSYFIHLESSFLNLSLKQYLFEMINIYRDKFFFGIQHKKG